MEPSTDHEFQIATAVDRVAAEGRLSARAFAEIISSLRFRLSQEEVQFIVTYVLWRMSNPLSNESRCPRKKVT